MCLYLLNGVVLQECYDPIKNMWLRRQNVGKKASNCYCVLSLAERNQPSCLTPRGAPLDIVASCSESPFVEGCSPIRGCSPHQLHCHNEPQRISRPRPRPRGRCWASPPLISPILNPKLPDNEVAEEHLPSATRSSFPSMELDSSSPLTQDSHPTNTERVGVDPMEPVKMEEGKETEIEPRLEYEEDEGVGPSEQLTSSRMVNASATENSHMFVSLLAEGSSIRYDSSMQVCKKSLIPARIISYWCFG